jgi:hypothetical protein
MGKVSVAFLKAILCFRLREMAKMFQLVETCTSGTKEGWRHTIKSKLSDYPQVTSTLWNTRCKWLLLRVLFGLLGNPHTPAKISHLVTSLSTSRQQVVFALLFTSCQQVWDKLLTICNNLVDIIRLVTRLFQQVRYSHDIAVLLQPCCRQPCDILVISWLCQTC